MKTILKRTAFILAALFSIIVLHASVSAHAALKPEPIEKKVILYTDSSPYTFRFINLSSDAKLSFTSSDKEVIRISDSHAVPVKAGKATVKIKVTQDKKKYTFKIKFTVKNVPKEKSSKEFEKLAQKTVKKLKSELTEYPRTTLNYGDDTVCKTKKMTDKRLYQNLRRYKEFTVVLSKLDVLRSEEEYLKMFPFLSSIELTDPRQYSNVISIIVKSEKSMSAFYEEEIELDYAISGGNLSYLSKDARKLYQKVIKAAEKLKKDTDFDTVKAVHDHVVKKFTYNLDIPGDKKYRLSYALDHGATVCSGYAKYFYFLCKALGYDARFVIGGEEKGSDTHGWNLVEIGHKWYGVDVTWDDHGKENPNYYMYFLIADEDMRKDHWWNESDYPKAVSRDLGIIYSDIEKYPVVNGEKEAVEFIEEEIDKLAASDKNEKKLEFREMTATNQVFSVINEKLNKYGSKYGIAWRDWKTDNGAPPGWVYRITIYKR